MALYLCKIENQNLVAIVGRVVEKIDGWQFLPNTSTHKPSRKAWPTAQAAIPAWARKPELVLMNKAEMNATQMKPALRPLNEYESMVFAFMARRPYTRCHNLALDRATTQEDRDDVIQRAIDRYEDWATD
jgi:hypothetical protein